MNLRAWRFACVVGMSAFACAADSEVVLNGLSVPIPEGAKRVTTTESGADTSEVTYVLLSPAGTESVDDFYAEWALANGWVPVEPEEDRWVSNEWVSFLVHPDTQVHQLTRAWRNPVAGRSLLLALRRFDKEKATEVFVVHAPAMIVSAPDEPVPTARELIELYGDGHIPQGAPPERADDSK